jgi:hypothetical protein
MWETVTIRALTRLDSPFYLKEILDLHDTGSSDTASGNRPLCVQKNPCAASKLTIVL